MTERDLPVFVYGTLRPGGDGFAELDLHDKVDVIGGDRIAGTLYRLPGYPAMIPGGPGLVSGELLRLLDISTLTLLDGYELFDPRDPGGSEYRRVEVTTRADVRAWTYAYNRSTRDLPIIPDGVWPAT